MPKNKPTHPPKPEHPEKPKVAHDEEPISQSAVDDPPPQIPPDTE